MNAIHELTQATHPALFEQLAGDVDKPKMIWASGNLDALDASRQRVAIEGSRASTAYGDMIAAEFSRKLSSDYAIVTGGAYGIAAASIRATLAEGAAPIVVLSGGVDRYYPSGHTDLFNSVIAGGGVVLSSQPLGTSPSRYRFLQAHRHIAAITDATLVVEAGWRSGALYTANMAHEFGRVVGAVPGPITSTSSTGNHRLIADGIAKLVTSPEDITRFLEEKRT